MTTHGVTFVFSGLRIYLQIEAEGAMPIDAYQIIRNSLIRFTGTAETLFTRAMEKLRN